MFKKKMIESTFIKILIKKQKNLIIGCVYKHPKLKVKDFKNNHMMPLLAKLSNENKDVMIMVDFNVNLINSNNDKNTSNFLDAMLSHSFLPFITTPPRITRNTRTLNDNIFYNRPLKACVCYFLSNFYFSSNDSSSKTMKFFFYFIYKALFILEIFRFLYFCLPLFFPCHTENAHQKLVPNPFLILVNQNLVAAIPCEKLFSK